MAWLTNRLGKVAVNTSRSRSHHPAPRPAPGASGASRCGKAAVMLSAFAGPVVGWRFMPLRGAGRGQPACASRLSAAEMRRCAHLGSAAEESDGKPTFDRGGRLSADRDRAAATPRDRRALCEPANAPGGNASGVELLVYT